MSAPRKKKAVQPFRYGPGSYRPAPNGRGFDVLLCHANKRHRARVPTEAAATAWIDATESRLRASRPPLTREQLHDAMEAIALLPAGATLREAAAALASSRAGPPDVPLADAVSRFMADRAHSAKPITLKRYRHVLAALSNSLGPSCPTASVTHDHLADLLGERAGITRNNWIRALSTFFTWCVAAELAPSDPSARLTRARVPEPGKGVLTVQQARALLACAVHHKPRMVPWLAVALFTGIRPAELSRLTPAAIGPEFITLSGFVTKTADWRHVRIRPNLAAWLSAHPPEDGRPLQAINTKNHYAALRAIRSETVKLAESAKDKTLSAPDWPDDCTRHSFASYAYEESKDAAAVAAELGHRGTDIFFRHYRALAHPGDGAAYFSITPESLSSLLKILQQPAQTLANQRPPKLS